MNKTPGIRWGLWLSLLAGALVLSALGWWWVAPRACRFVGRCPAGPGWVCWARPAGLVYSESAPPLDPASTCALSLRDWSGTRRWTVRLPAARGRGGWLGRDLALSPDGQALAVVTGNGPSMRLVCWYAGAEMGRLTLPIPRDGVSGKEAAFAIALQDSGRMLLYRPFSPATPIYLIEGERVLARASHNTALAIPSGGQFERRISTDGRCLLGRVMGTTAGDNIEYAALDSSHGLSVTPRYTARDANPRLSLLDGGFAVSWSGTIYDEKGAAAPDGWEGYAEETAGQWLAQKNGESARALCPALNKSWKMPNPLAVRAVEITPDGAYAVTYERGLRTPPAPAKPLLKTAPGQAIARVGRDHGNILVYRSPGMLAARLQLHSPPGEAPYILLDGGERFDIDYVFLSPDGHKLAVRGRQAGKTGFEYLFYEW